MLIPCTQAQFEAALAALKTAPGVTVTEKDATNGAVTDPDVDFSYSFNGTQLMLLILKKHGLYHFTPDDKVYAGIQAKFVQAEG